MEIKNSKLLQRQSLRKIAIFTGSAYLVMFVVGILTALFVPQNFIVPGDAAKTAYNIINNEILFRLDIFKYLVFFICDLLLAWGFYIFLCRINKRLSLLAAWFKLGWTAISGTALFNRIAVLYLLSDHQYLSVFDKDQLYAMALLSLDTFSYKWYIGYIFFSIHILILGYLFLKLDYAPKILGILLLIVSFAYLLYSFASLLIPDMQDFEIIRRFVFLPGFITEMWLALWLLLKGGKNDINHI